MLERKERGGKKTTETNSNTPPRSGYPRQAGSHDGSISRAWPPGKQRRRLGLPWNSEQKVAVNPLSLHDQACPIASRTDGIWHARKTTGLQGPSPARRPNYGAQGCSSQFWKLQGMHKRTPNPWDPTGNCQALTLKNAEGTMAVKSQLAAPLSTPSSSKHLYYLIILTLA